MKKIMSTLSILAVVVGYCIGQEINIGDTDGCNNSKLGDELYGILYADDEEQYIQDHQHIAVDTLGLDSIKFVYYPNGAVCYEQWFFGGKCTMMNSYYSNGQIFKSQIDRENGVNERTESFPVDYGKYCYLYGFKVNRRTNLLYNCDGTPWRICFLGIYNHKKVSIQIDFLNFNHRNRLVGAWIRKKDETLIRQFDWDEASQTWTTPAVNHVTKKSRKTKPKELLIY